MPRAKKFYSLLTCFTFIIVLVPIGYYIYSVHCINTEYRSRYEIQSEIGLRKFPYPYKAALSIVNDIDSTDTLEEFTTIQEFLNTKNMTKMGPGIGLEISNSFFFYHPSNGFSYYSTNPDDRLTIRKLIKTGYIDSIHSYGDGYNGRKMAEKALNELSKNKLKLNIWTNHSFEYSNLHNWFSANLGDVKESKYYHSDLLVPYGIKFVWLGSCTYVIGQASPIDLYTFTGSGDSAYPVKSATNIAKALIKHIGAVFGFWKTKYALHASNDLVRIATLEDGQKVYEFMRYDNHPDGIGIGATSRSMEYNLSERVIEQLKAVNGYALLYSHLGKNSDCPEAICEETRRKLRYLEDQYRSGEVYVTTTSKILTYYINHKYLKWSSQTSAEKVTIRIDSVEDPLSGSYVPDVKQLQGITFYVPPNKGVQIFIADREIKKYIKNPADETNRVSVTIPFTRLEYPD